jgi:hypothetical protein
VEDVRWHHYFSRNIVKFRSGGVGFIGLFVAVEATARVLCPNMIAALSPGFDLVNFVVCFALYWRIERLLDGLPDRGWSASRERRDATLEVGKGRRVGWLVVMTGLLSVCVIALFVPDRELGAILLVAAAWLGLHRVRAREVWGYHSATFWVFAVAGTFYLMMPRLAVDNGVTNMLWLAEFGIALMVMSFVLHRDFVRHVGLRGG